MHVRLAFSVAVQVDAEILLIDEVLAVGDAAFQQKCFDQFGRLKKEGRTIIFVTHDMGSVERFCDRAMLMEKGRVVDIGSPDVVARKYNDLNFKRSPHVPESSVRSEGGRERPTAGVTSTAFEDADGEVIVSANQGETVVARVEVSFHETLENPIIGMSLRNEQEQPVFASSTAVDGIKTGHFSPGDRTTVRFRFENMLGPGRYSMQAFVARDGLGADLLDLHEDSSLIVVAVRAGGGAADLPHTIELERS